MQPALGRPFAAAEAAAAAAEAEAATARRRRRARSSRTHRQTDAVVRRPAWPNLIVVVVVGVVLVADEIIAAVAVNYQLFYYIYRHQTALFSKNNSP